MSQGEDMRGQRSFLDALGEMDASSMPPPKLPRIELPDSMDPNAAKLFTAVLDHQGDMMQQQHQQFCIFQQQQQQFMTALIESLRPAGGGPCAFHTSSPKSRR